MEKKRTLIIYNTKKTTQEEAEHLLEILNCDDSTLWDEADRCGFEIIEVPINLNVCKQDVEPIEKEETENSNSVADTTHITDTEFAGNVIIHGDCEVRGDLTVYGSLISIETVYEDRLVYKNVDIKELPFTERLKAIFKL